MAIIKVNPHQKRVPWKLKEMPPPKILSVMMTPFERFISAVTGHQAWAPESAKGDWEKSAGKPREKNLWDGPDGHLQKFNIKLSSTAWRKWQLYPVNAGGDILLRFLREWWRRPRWLFLVEL